MDEIAELKRENELLRAKLTKMESLGLGGGPTTPATTAPSPPPPPAPVGSSLCNEHIRRYSRQLLVPALGVKGQLQLLKASVLVIGAGGLGSAVLPYIVG
ncbi:unnamed protein product, partial [Chrysoparadoxa australica]